MLHFELGKLINFRHFLLKSLDKMSKTVQKTQKDQIGFKLSLWFNQDSG